MGMGHFKHRGFLEASEKVLPHSLEVFPFRKKKKITHPLVGKYKAYNREYFRSSKTAWTPPRVRMKLSLWSAEPRDRS